MKYFVIQDGGPVPCALVRTHQGVEETFTGEWAESGLLASPEPGWTVDEVDSWGFYDHVYRVTRAARAAFRASRCSRRATASTS